MQFQFRKSYPCAHDQVLLLAHPHLLQEAVPGDMKGLPLDHQLSRLEADDVHYTPEDKAVIRRGLVRLGRQDKIAGDEQFEPEMTQL